MTPAETPQSEGPSGRAWLVPDAPKPPANSVTIVDFDMPFMSMVVFMLKLAVAAIPAMLILVVLGAISTTFISALLLSTLRTGTSRPYSYETTTPRDTRPHTMKEWHEKCDQWQGPDDVNTINAQLCKQELEVLSK